MKKLLISAALVFASQFAFAQTATPTGDCEAKAVSKAGKPLAGAAKTEGCQQERQATHRRRQGCLHQEVREGRRSSRQVKRQTQGAVFSTASSAARQNSTFSLRQV